MEESRSDRRRRTRLQTGKMYCFDSGFLADCQIVNKSETGLLIRMLDNIALPNVVGLFDDQTLQSFKCKVIRKDGRLIGLRISKMDNNQQQLMTHQAKLRGKFYAARSGGKH